MNRRRRTLLALLLWIAGGGALLPATAFAPSGAFRRPLTTTRTSFSSGPSSAVDQKQNKIPHQLVSTTTRTAATPALALGAPAAAVNGSTAAADRRAACFPATTPWEVHKFGGASLADAGLYRTVGDLLLRERGRKTEMIPTLAVVSARGGMTDLLVKVVDSALVNFEDAETALAEAVASQIAVLRELAPDEITAPIIESIDGDAKDILSVVQSLRMLNTVPAVTMEVVTGFGEIW